MVQTESSDAGHSEKSGGHFGRPNEIVERLRARAEHAANHWVPDEGRTSDDDDTDNAAVMREAASTIERLVEALESLLIFSDLRDREATADDYRNRHTAQESARRALTGGE